MCRFIETICFENGQYPLLDLHQERVNKAFAYHFPGEKPHLLSEVLPQLDFKGKYKVRMEYDQESMDIEWSEYQKRTIRSIKLIPHDSIDYSHKYADRAELKALYDQRGEADEILIIKKGCVTDAFYYHPVFWDGKSWYCPDTYLLNGVMRQHLLREGKIRQLPINEKDIPSFRKICLINAMNGLGDVVVNSEWVR